MRIVELSGSAEISRLQSSPLLPPFSHSDFEEHAADLHLCAVSENDEVLCRGSLWWKQVPEYPGHKIGAVGHYGCIDDAAANGLLAAACESREGLRSFGVVGCCNYVRRATGRSRLPRLG